MKQQICILGSTGSIGTQALDVIEQHSDLYEVYALTANNHWRELAAQARKFRPAAVVIANADHYEALTKELEDQPRYKSLCGSDALKQIVEAEPINMVLAAMVGFSVWSQPSMLSRQERRFAWQIRKRSWSLENLSASWRLTIMLRYYQ